MSDLHNAMDAEDGEMDTETRRLEPLSLSAADGEPFSALALYNKMPSDALEDDYFYEAGSMLKLINTPLPWEARMAPLARMEDANDRRHKNLHLLNFVALTLVRKAKDDICAVAVSLSEKAVEVYYTKNHATVADVSIEANLDDIHASSLKSVVRAAARRDISKLEFFEQYFQSVKQNCAAKLARRITALSTACKSAPAKSNVSSVVEEMKVLLSSSSWPMDARNESDIQALELSETDNLPEAVLCVFTELVDILKSISEATGRQSALDISSCTTEKVLDICLLSWIIGQSSTVKAIVSRVRSASRLAKLISCLRKLGTYYRGLDLLYAAIMDSRLNAKYQALIIRRVPSAAVVTPALSSEWYKCLDVIYYRQRDRNMLLSPSHIISAYPTLNQYHKSWTVTAVRHAEVRLVDHLSALGRRPAEIGVSKLCCRCCYVWINAVNNEIIRNGGSSIWAVSGTHGKTYPWAKDSSSNHGHAETKVRNDMYEQLARALDSIQPLMTDSDNELKRGATQQVRSDAAEQYKSRHRRV